MSEQASRKTEILNVTQYFDNDEPDCPHCGDTIYEDDDIAGEPGTWGGRKTIEYVHSHCAVKDGYRLVWDTADDGRRGAEATS